MISITCCLIVKNEEAVLARCLESLKGLVDETVIVDTGSTDRTKEIALQYTDKVYDFAWTDDFSAARNFSFSFATKDYIYAADADEVIDEENRHRFKILKETLLPEIEIVQMMYCNQLQYNTTYNYDRELRPKLYKRLRQFVWVDPLHESVRREPVVFDSDVEIIHMPAGDHSERDFRTFLRAIRVWGGLSKKLRDMYARELYIAGGDEDFLAAAPYFTELSEKEGLDIEELKICQCIISRAARLGKDERTFIKAALKLLALGNINSEICCELGEYYYGLSDFKEAMIWYYNAAFEAKPVLGIKYGHEYPLDRLIECSTALGDEKSAEAYRKLRTNVQK